MEAEKGYYLLDEIAGHKLTNDSRIYIKGHGWLGPGGWCGMTISPKCTVEHYTIIAVAVKGEPKPRFKTDKPWPFGY